MNCPWCGQPLLELKCERCFGFSYIWVQDERGEEYGVDCPECGGSGKEHPCTNTTCPGIKWYPLSRADSATLRGVISGIERDEASKKFR